MKGDGRAALAVAKYYESPRHTSNESAMDWYERAASLGQVAAYRKLFDAYSLGSITPRNAAKAEEYLERAREAGAEWAVLVAAKRLESSDPQAAVDRYLKAADQRSDRCIVTVDDARLDPVAGMRAHGDIRVGETVYTIGSPRGLERTLGQGIVSGLRHDDGITFIQTTAQISPGSSGRGLFDAAGNLVGVTALAAWGQGLNFAIAIDEYFHQ